MNLVIAVTGGARGIGLATATALQGLGAKVAIGDIDEPAVKDAGSRLGLRVCRGLDVTDRQSFTEFLDSVEDQLGPLDVMVNNAGVIAVGSAVDEADAVTQGVLDVNVWGVILGTKLAAQRMLSRGRGHIINIASVGSLLPAAGIATYCATKHAVLGYTDSVRMENHGSGIHFSAILPTLTNTEMIAGVGHARGFKNAEPEDVARAVAGVIANRNHAWSFLVRWGSPCRLSASCRFAWPKRLRARWAPDVLSRARWTSRSANHMPSGPGRPESPRSLPSLPPPLGSLRVLGRCACGGPTDGRWWWPRLR
jgi:NAD(P)-dependent dehydrogenase (short-subunit alcohol dehydrogenase family)